MSRLLRGGALGILVALVSAMLGTDMAHGAQQSSAAGPAQLLWAHEDAPLDFNNPFRAVITKIDPIQGVPLLTFEQGYLGYYARALGVDGKRETVWALGGAELKAFDFAGTLLRTVVLAESAYSGDLAVNPTDGSLWVTFSYSSEPMMFRLQRRDAQGQVLLDLSSPSISYRHLTLDPPRGRVWVARQDEMGYPRGVEAYL